jgi:hypothetical protein
MSHEQLARNTKEQYEMLGRFVEAFEMMVSEVRESIIGFFEHDRRGGVLAEIALHHSALSAKPLFDIFRAMIVEMVNKAISEQEHGLSGPDGLLIDRKGNRLQISASDRDTIFGVLTFLQGKYDSLANRRNDLLHGTWFVGYSSSEDLTASEFYIQKFRTSKQGLVPAADLPKNAVQVKALSERCDDVRNWVCWLITCLEGTTKIADTFQNDKVTWWFVTPAGIRSTLA